MLAIIGGRFKRRKLVVPKSDQVRPTTSQVREAVFNICQNEVVGAQVLDLFAGSGAIGFEALSRGAKHVTFVENHYLAIAAIKKNISELQVAAETTLYNGDVFKIIERLSSQRFDLIYIDPPYGKGLGVQLLNWIDHHDLLKSEGTLFLEDLLLEEPTLHHLALISKRTIGRALLLEYKKKG